MGKVELGTILALVLAVIGGALYIGVLEGRVAALENDKDFSSLANDKAEAVSAISTAKTSALDQISEIAARESPESFIFNKMNLMCGIINDNWDYGKAYPITTNTTCNAVCEVSGEHPDSACAGMVSFDPAYNRYARKACDQILGQDYTKIVKPHLENYCCCR